jgi:uracil-DNA glycosylase family 4
MTPTPGSPSPEASDATVAVRGPVPPGTGWPGDVATAATPVAHGADEVRQLAAGAPTLLELVARQSVCRACPRLVDWREEVARVRRRSFATEQYWGRPIPGWGDDEPEIVIVGLAPAAHGGNRTGRVFTGDRSGDFLFASLYRCGLADSPVSVTAGDGQRLRHTRMVAAVRCAPPANKPTPGERDTCAPWLAEELRRITPSARVLICLGGFAWQALWPVLRATGFVLPSRRPAFGHGAEAELGPPPVPAAAGVPGVPDASSQPSGPGASPGPDAPPVLLLGCYHPSQQNTFTGRITPDMLDEIFRRARAYAGLDPTT